MDTLTDYVTDIACIVVSWNQYQLTRDCICSLINNVGGKFRLIVVDNGSTDYTAQKLEQEFGSRIDLLLSERNLGFTGGNNLGIQHALARGAKYILLLNNDTIVPKDFLAPLLDIINTNTGIAAVTPKIYFLDSPETIWAAGGAINWWLGSMSCRGLGELDKGQYDSPGPVDFATGCCLLTRREVLERVGLLDERFFAYFEDSEWCLRARHLGYSIWYTPESHIYHLGSGSSVQKQGKNRQGASSPFQYYLNARNSFLCIRKHGRGIRRMTAILGFGVRFVLFFSLGFLILRRWSKLEALWLGTVDGLLDRNGGLQKYPALQGAHPVRAEPRLVPQPHRQSRS